MRSTAELLDVSARIQSPLATLYTQYIERVLRHCDALNKQVSIPGVLPCSVDIIVLYCTICHPVLQVGALIIEPLFIGAGGFKLVDPLFQHLLVARCRARGIPVVYDEVAVGMGRLGPPSLQTTLRAAPDVAAYGKLLTGGYLPLAVTLATEETFACFKGLDSRQALLHGHSYTANPISCAAAVEAIRQANNLKGSVCFFTDADAERLSMLTGVSSTVALGSILSLDLAQSTHDVSITAAEVIRRLRAEGVYARPLGNTVYVMTSLITTAEDKASLVEKLASCIECARVVLHTRNSSPSETTIV